MSKKELIILYFNILYIIIFGIIATLNKNYEFLFYVSIVVFLIILVLLKYKKLGLSTGVLWGLSLWGLLHMLGGNIHIGDDVLYGLQIIPKVLRYDQFVHAFGFGVTTVVGFQLLKSYLKESVNWVTLSILLVMIGLGVGALNEIIEFMTVLSLPETGVGGYMNTMWDMVFNMIGSIIAVVYINYHKK
jgi:putative membrane protein